MLNFSGRRLPALAQYSKREAASVITNFRLTALRMAASAKRSLGGKSSAASVESRDRQERRARLQENIREVQQRRADQSRGRQERGAGLQEDIPAAELARKGGHPLPEPTGIAKQVLDAGRKRRGEIAIEPELPPADSLTAEILAAGRKRRGETTIEPELPPADSLAAKILAAGRKRRGETTIEPELPPADSLAAKILASGRKRRGETTIEPELPPADSLNSKNSGGRP